MKKLERLTPPGTDISAELKAYIIAAVVFILMYGFSFLFKYASEYYKLEIVYFQELGIRASARGAMMPGIDYIMPHCYVGFWGYTAMCLVEIALHYRSFYAGSKSIYLMRRIKNANELHIRCLTLPLMALLAGIVFTLVLIGLDVLFYIIVTPKACMGSAAVNIIDAFI